MKYKYSLKKSVYKSSTNITITMDHLAILSKSWGMLERITSGDKTIESRWYQTKRCPWNQIKTGDNIYFKNSGEPVTVKAKVSGVKQVTDLSLSKINNILEVYGPRIGISHCEKEVYLNLFKSKKYCILVFLETPQLIEAFDVDKKMAGFGPQCAWLMSDDINKIRK